MAQDQLHRIAALRLSASDLLAIFDTNPARAADKYIELYQSLVRYFEWNRKSDAEDLAQESLKRGFSRLQQGQKITTREPAGYFFGIARNLLREEWRTRKHDQFDGEELPSAPAPFHNLDAAEQQVLLHECIRNLSHEELDMLLAYVEGDGETLARKTGLQPGALRLRIHRIRKRLEKLISIRARGRAD
jgi:DNA-directed RNA polymerase specialized sigma24 family protein